MSEHKGLAEALVAFQADAPTLRKDAINPHFKSRYTPLDTIVETIQPILAKHGLAWSSLPCTVDGAPALRYRLLHGPSGEVLEDTMPLLLPKQDVQGLGSALTYCRRYSMTAVLNLVSDVDDDGEAASAKASERSQPSNGGELATPDDVKSMVAAAKDLTPEQVKLALAACGIPDVKTYGQVPRAKTAELAKRLAGIER